MVNINKRKFNKTTVILLTISLIFGGVQVRASDTSSDIQPEKTIAAQWKANAVKITFNSNGGGVAPGEQVYTYGAERSLPGVCSMQKEGCTFLGWAESDTATTPDWQPGATSNTAFGYSNNASAASKTLYAVWKEETPSIADTLNNITSFLGLLNKATTPTSTGYDNASLVEKVNYLENELNTLKSDVGTVNTNISSIKSTVSGLSSSSGEVIKSVQRGYVEISAGDTRDIYINNIDPSKSIVILDPVGLSTPSGQYSLSFDSSLSANKLNIRSNVYYYYSNAGYNFYSNGNLVFRIGWQVIEFY